MATTIDKFLQPQVRQRIRYLLGINARDIRSIDYYFEHKLAAYFGLLYRELERGTPDERYYVYLLRRITETKDRVERIRWKFPELAFGTLARFYASAVLAEWDARQGIKTLELFVERRRDLEKAALALFIEEHGRDPTPEELEEATDRELLDRAIELKSKEYKFLEDLVAALQTRVPERPEWAEEVKKVWERVRVRLEELLAMKKLWRIHKCHMWYRSYKARETPDPYAMVSVFVYTRTPDKYTEEMFDSALDFLETDPEAFPTFGMALTSASLAAVRKGYSAPGAYYEVEGWEREQVDEDEKGDYNEDEWRYYLALYRTRGGRVEIYREYWGRLEPIVVGGKIVGWRIYAQDKTEPVWKKSEELGWPEGLEA